jgi:hypothetical protein
MLLEIVLHCPFNIHYVPLESQDCPDCDLTHTAWATCVVLYLLIVSLFLLFFRLSCNYLFTKLLYFLYSRQYIPFTIQKWCYLYEYQHYESKQDLHRRKSAFDGTLKICMYTYMNVHLHVLIFTIHVLWHHNHVVHNNWLIMAICRFLL